MRAAQLLHIMPVTGTGRWLTSPVEYTISPLALFNQEVVYPLRYTQWYNDKANGYDFACNADLADLERIHPLWTFEKKLKSWGIDEIKPAK